MNTIRLACHIVNWGNDLLTALDEVTAAGFRAFETSAQHLTEVGLQAGEFQQMLSLRSMNLVALDTHGGFIDTNTNSEEIDRNLRLAKLLAEVGCDLLVVSGGAKLAEGNTPDQYALLGKTLSELGRQTLDLGVHTCYHPQIGTMVENRKQIEILCELSDPKVLSLCLDTEELTRSGTDVLDAFQVYGERLRHIHLRRGTVDFPEIVKVLKGNDYEGWIAIEGDATERSPRENAITTRDCLTHLL